MSGEVQALERVSEILLLYRLETEPSISLENLKNACRDHDEKDQWVVLAPSSAHIRPHLAELLIAASAQRQDVEIFYGDEVEYAGHSEASPILVLKPAFDFTMLAAVEYIGYPVIVKYMTLVRLCGFTDYAGTAKVYELLLRAYSDGVVIERIPEVLVAYQGSRVRAALHDRVSVLKQWTAKHMPGVEVKQGRIGSSLQLLKRFVDHPCVTLVVPTRQRRQTVFVDDRYGQPNVINLLDSLKCTDWPMSKLRILIGDDLENDDIYRDKNWPFRVDRVRTIHHAGKYDYATKINELWKMACTEQIVLIHDDIVIKDGGWLKAMLTFSVNNDVGGVGARLLYGNGNIQHAGIAGGIFDALAHVWLNSPSENATYENWAAIHREWSMVTGAVFATRKSALEAVGGFDERFKTEFSDVDLCLRQRLLGFKIIYTPFAELIHYETSSREQGRANGSECALFLRRWHELIDNDPAFHPGLEKQNLAVSPAPSANSWYQSLPTI